MTSKKGFEHFDVISMVDKDKDHGKLLSICFFNNIDSFDVHLRDSFSEHRPREKEKNKLRHRRYTVTVRQNLTDSPSQANLVVTQCAPSPQPTPLKKPSYLVTGESGFTPSATQ